MGAAAMEKKQRQFDKLIAEWKQKCEDLTAELVTSQTEAKTCSTELFKLKTQYEESQEHLELSQIRQEIDRRLAEKEDEFENTRKNHARALESMQASLEAETKAKQEALRMKKKLEADINELEVSLDHANRANAESMKQIKKYLAQIKELSASFEEEQRAREEAREAYNMSERRCNMLTSELEEMRVALEASDRARKAAEGDSTTPLDASKSSPAPTPC